MKKKDLKIIRKINEEAWNKFGKDLFDEKYVAPDVRETVRKILEDKPKDFPKEKLEQLQVLWDSGRLDMKEQVVKEDIALEMDKYVQGRLVEEIKAGRLTNPKEDKNYKDFKKKITQDARRRVKKGSTINNDRQREEGEPKK